MNKLKRFQFRFLHNRTMHDPKYDSLILELNGGLIIGRLDKAYPFNHNDDVIKFSEAISFDHNNQPVIKKPCSIQVDSITNFQQTKWADELSKYSL